MNQFSEKFYINVRQTLGTNVISFTLPRLKHYDDIAELMPYDLKRADFHATMHGSFSQGYYDVELCDFDDYKIVDSESCIL